MRRSGVLFLLLAIALAGCSSHKIRSAQHSRTSIKAVSKQSPVSPLRRKVNMLLERKHYRQALEMMNSRSHEGFEKEYVLAINGLLEIGDAALSQGDCESSIRAFKSVLDAYSEISLKERIHRDPKQIRAMIGCENRLMEQGLQEYRGGRLESAIRSWKYLLAVNPGHQEARKALDTATVQLQALQNLKSSKEETPSNKPAIQVVK